MRCTCCNDNEPGGHHAVHCPLYRSPFKGPDAEHWDQKLRERFAKLQKNMPREYDLQRISKAKIGELAEVLRQLAEHCKDDHNCPDSAELIEAIANRLDFYHRGASAIAARRIRRHGVN